MAAAQLIIRYLGASGRLYCISGYASDVAAVAVKFDESKIAVAGSFDSYVTKEPGTLVDVAMASALATPTHLQIQRNGTPTGDILNCTCQQITVVARPNPNTPFAAGDKIGIMQLS